MDLKLRKGATCRETMRWPEICRALTTTPQAGKLAPGTQTIENMDSRLRTSGDSRRGMTNRKRKLWQTLNSRMAAGPPDLKAV